MVRRFGGTFSGLRLEGLQHLGGMIFRLGHTAPMLLHRRLATFISGTHLFWRLKVQYHSEESR